MPGGKNCRITRKAENFAVGMGIALFYVMLASLKSANAPGNPARSREASPAYMTTIEDITKSFTAEVMASLNGVLAANGKVRWNQDDSATAIMEIAGKLSDAKQEAMDNPDFNDNQRGVAIDALKATAKAYTYELCNPSQFRQKLEDSGKIPKATKQTRKATSLIAGL